MQRTWINEAFGKRGWFFPILCLACLPLSGCTVIALGVAVFGDNLLWQRLLAASFGAYGAIYLYKIVEIVMVARLTVKEITFYGSTLKGRTFTGKKIKVTGFSEMWKRPELFRKKHMQTLFKEGDDRFLITSNGGSYYFSAVKDESDALKQVIKDIKKT